MRWALGAMLVVGCGSSDPGTAIDAPGTAPMRTAKFSPLLCTSGSPGDPTCPINTLEAFDPVLTIAFVAQPLAQDLNLTSIKVTPSSSVHLEGLWVESWGSGTVPAGMAELATTLDFSQERSLAPVTLTAFSSAQTLLFRVDVLRILLI